MEKESDKRRKKAIRKVSDGGGMTSWRGERKEVKEEETRKRKKR